MLLASLAYTEEDAADKFPKDIAAMAAEPETAGRTETEAFCRARHCPD